MAVPNTNDFKLQDVVDEINPTTDDLVDCFADADSNEFDPYYEGSKDRLSNFRNYGFSEFESNPNWELSCMSLSGNTKIIDVFGTGLDNSPVGYEDRLHFSSNIGAFFNSSGTKLMFVGLRINTNTGIGDDESYINLLEYNLSTPYDIDTITFANHEEISTLNGDGQTTIHGRATISKDNTKVYVTLHTDPAPAPYASGLALSTVVEIILTGECELPVSYVNDTSDAHSDSLGEKYKYLFRSKFSNTKYFGNQTTPADTIYFKDTLTDSFSEAITNFGSFTSAGSIREHIVGTIGDNDQYILGYDFFAQDIKQYRKINNSFAHEDTRAFTYDFSALNGDVTVPLHSIIQSDKLDKIVFFYLHFETSFQPTAQSLYKIHLIEYNTNFFSCGLTSFTGGPVYSTSTLACSNSHTSNTYYHYGTGAIPNIGDKVYNSQNITDVIQSGNIKYGSNDYLTISGGVVTAKDVCSLTAATGFYSNLGTGFGGSLYNVTVQPDGKILVGGQFTTLNGNTRNRLVRLNSDGTEDTSFYTNLGGGFNNIVQSIEIQSDGKILVGGFFDNFNGNTRNRVVRLNSNGTEDTSFYTNLGTGFSSNVHNITIQTDGKILVGGSFRSFNGNTRNSLVRLNSNGTEDTSFCNNLGTAFDGNTGQPGYSGITVYSIYVQPDGKILVGGAFSAYNGNIRNSLIRLNSNGTEDNSFYSKLGFGFNDLVNSVYVQPDGKILVGGDFFYYFNGNIRQGLVRLNSNGTDDTSFCSNLGTGFNNDEVFSVYVQPDGKILVGGSFTALNGSTRNKLVRLNSNGTEDTSFYSNLGTGFESTFSTIRSVYVQSDGKILVGGAFITFNGNTRNRLVRLNSDGTENN